MVRPGAQGGWTGCLEYSKEAEGTQPDFCCRIFSLAAWSGEEQCVSRERVKQLCSNPGEMVVA